MIKHKFFFLIAFTLCTLNGMAQDGEFEMFFETNKNGYKVGLKDKTGTVVVPAAYEAVHWVFSEGLTIAMLNQKCGFFDPVFGDEKSLFIYICVWRKKSDSTATRGVRCTRFHLHRIMRQSNFNRVCNHITVGMFFTH